MPIPLDVNGTEYQYPETSDLSWGPDATDWAVAVTTGMLQKAGGLFILLSEVDFGGAAGLKSLYYKSRTSNIAAAGVLRLAVNDTISWRNNANSADLALSVNASDVLLFNGSPVASVASVSDTNSIDLTLAGSALSAALKLSAASADAGFVPVALSIESDGLQGQVAEADITGAVNLVSTDTIDVTNLGTSIEAIIAPLSIENSHVSSSAGIDYSKLTLASSILNSDISGSAAIALNKLATTTVSRALVSDGSGIISPATTTATEIGYVNGVTSAIQTQLDSKTAASMPTMTLKGNNTGGTANALNLTVSQVNTMLGTLTNPMNAAGQMIYGGASGTPTAVSAGTSGQYLKSNGTSAPAFTSFAARTIQRFTSGSGTYTTPAGVLYLKVTVVGGGGGGGGSATIAGANATAGGAGGNSTFGSTLLVGNGGSGGGANGSRSGAGGSASISGPTALFANSGSGGNNGTVSNTNTVSPAYGGNGGTSFFSGAGRGADNGAGEAGATNSGSGGGGAGGSQPLFSGAGGGSGGVAAGIITSPSASYAYAVGSAGNAGGAGTGGAAGGAGAAGIVIVEEFYQ